MNEAIHFGPRGSVFARLASVIVVNVTQVMTSECPAFMFRRRPFPACLSLSGGSGVKRRILQGQLEV